MRTDCELERYLDTIEQNIERVREISRERSAAVFAGGVYRIKSDEELQEFGYLPRVNPKCPRYVKLAWAPCTQRLYGDTGSMNLPARWRKEVQDHNSPIEFKRLTNKATGWVNKPGWPKVEQVCFSSDKSTYWNRVEVTAVSNGYAYIRTQTLTQRPIPYWWENPTLCHRFTVIDINTNVFYPDPPGTPMTLPLLSRAGRPLKIQLYKLAVVE